MQRSAGCYSIPGDGERERGSLCGYVFSVGCACVVLLFMGGFFVGGLSHGSHGISGFHALYNFAASVFIKCRRVYKMFLALGVKGTRKGGGRGSGYVEGLVELFGFSERLGCTLLCCA